jgi:transposase
MEQVYKTAIEGLKKSISAIDILIKKIISADEALKKNYNLLLTIPGIGNVTAVYLVVCTNNFAGNISGKQLACYAGVAPFANTSGISIKGKEKVHKMANKELKKLLFMCAMATLQYSPEMKQYYERKTAEGKHGFSVLNAIKNKLLLRVASVIKNQKPYVDNYKPSVDNLKKAS